MARIDYNEFLKVVLSWNNSDLRTSAVLRPNSDLAAYNLLPSSVEASLSALIAKETDIFDALYVPFVREYCIRIKKPEGLGFETRLLVSRYLQRNLEDLGD